jgi:hypothetical protein
LQIIKNSPIKEIFAIYKNGLIIAILQIAIYKNGQIIEILQIIKIPSIGNFAIKKKRPNYCTFSNCNLFKGPIYAGQ